MSPSRAAAFDILERLETTSAHSDDLLHGPGLVGLSQPDRDLTTALVLGVLRWQIALDAQLQALLSRPEEGVPGPVATALRLGALQLLHMDRIPPHAALNESVELVRRAGHPHAAGMVNAILRRLVNAARPRKPLRETTEAMATRLGHPAWLAEGWERQYGRGAAESICGFDQNEPLCAELFSNEEAMPLMDAGSRLVAELAAAAQPGAERVWDCCAAPGGKTLVLASRLPEASLLATDAHPARTARLADRLRRERPDQTHVHVEQADAVALPESHGTFDLILCDVPCSGTGTLARNPEIRHRLRPEDLSRQADRQKRILQAALGRLRPGGRLLYSTCSLEGEECEAVLGSVLAGQPDIARVELTPLLQALETSSRLHAAETQWKGWVRDGCLRTLPGAGFDGDGFFAALLRKSEGLYATAAPGLNLNG